MRVTLTDIAKRLGVTPSTVQRALNGAPGVSAARRAEIIALAAEMRYKPNFFASTLKRGGKRMAVVLPDLDRLNRHYAFYIWQGIHQYMLEAASMGVEVVRLPVATTQEHNACLEKLLEGAYGSIDGVITRGIRTHVLDSAFRRLSEAGIPVVLVGIDLETKNRICCVKCPDAIQGRMAADLLTGFGGFKTPGAVLVCGNFAGTDQYNNACGFEMRMRECGVPVEVQKLTYNVDPLQIRDALAQAVEGEGHVCAIYACSARSTIAVCEAIQHAGMAGRVHAIGSDIFMESAAYMRNGVLQAVLHSRPTVMAYQAAQALVATWTHGEAAFGTDLLIDPCVVMRGSLDFYTASLPHFESEDTIQSVDAMAMPLRSTAAMV